MAFSRTVRSSPNNQVAASARAMLRASMYFAFAGKARAGVSSRTTFEAILAGERTSTTRFPAWGGYARWKELHAGECVRFYADRDMRGRFVDVIVESVEPIDLARCTDERLEAWSMAEGWSPSAGRGFGRQYGPGLQIRYRVKP